MKAERDHQPPSRGFPLHIFPSPGRKGVHGAHPPWGQHPGAAPRAGCSLREEEERWGEGRRRARMEGTA